MKISYIWNMTRTQFLLLLYKKLFRPALLLLVVWYAVKFVIAIINSDSSVTVGEGVLPAIAKHFAYLLGIVLLYAGLAKAFSYTTEKLGIDTTPDSKTDKIIDRLFDIARSMVLLYMWQTNPAYAIGWGAAIAMGMRDDYKKQQAVKAE